MTNADIDYLQEKLGIVLPSQYVDLILGEYPFEGEQWENCQLWQSCDVVVKDNIQMRRLCQDWNAAWFTFGHDGAGNIFFLMPPETSDTTVYCRNHETTEITAEAGDLVTWCNTWTQSSVENSANPSATSIWQKLVHLATGQSVKRRSS
ncbi:MAG: SMI1/KNR4 family protein [Planctomycetota bacterium]